jgi:probable phosphoglycerate mutase
VSLVAIRHAPTAWNRERRLQGRTDIALSPDGIATARRWRPLPEWRRWRVLASPLRRARETAGILFPDGDIALDARLVEMDFGDWEGRTLAELRGEAGSDAESRESLGLDFRAPNGESPREVQRRIMPVLATIAADAQPAVIVTHKAVLRALYSLASGWQMLGKPPVKLLPDTAHLYRLGPDGTPRIDRMNLPLLADDAAS